MAGDAETYNIWETANNDNTVTIMFHILQNGAEHRWHSIRLCLHISNIIPPLRIS